MKRPPDIPQFLKRSAAEADPEEIDNTGDYVAKPFDRSPEAEAAEAMRKAEKRTKAMNRIGRLKAKQEAKAAIAAGKRWDGRKGKWV